MGASSAGGATTRLPSSTGRRPRGQPRPDRRLVVATGSRHKLDELRALLHLSDARLLSLPELGVVDEPEETARTFRGNAIAKARHYAALTGLPTLADDSGLEVDALGGGPGVHTKYYAGESATDDDNNAKLLGALRGLPPPRRGARYRCVLAYLDPGGAADGALPWVVTRSGTFRGRIATEPRGTGGFGYDPLFEPATEPPGGRTVGEMTADEKNRMSHRARAARAMARYLREQGW